MNISDNYEIYRHDKTNWQLYELFPDDSRISFYKKALVLWDRHYPTWNILFSYGIPVLGYNIETMEYARFIDFTSVTTSRHIKAFSGKNKKDFADVPFTNFDKAFPKIYDFSHYAPSMSEIYKQIHNRNASNYWCEYIRDL